MKKVLKYNYLIILMLLFAMTSCSNSSGGGVPAASEPPKEDTPVEEKKKDFTISNLQFDSLTFTMQANTSAPNGTTLAASANNNAETATVYDGKLTWNMQRSFHDAVMGGKDYTITFSAEGYNDTTGKVSYLPKLRYELSCDEVELIFTGAGRDYQMPEINIKNYENSDVTVNWWFQIDNKKCNVDTFKTYVDEEESTSNDTSSSTGSEKTAGGRG